MNRLLSLFPAALTLLVLQGFSRPPDVLVELDARDMSAGEATWQNRGSIGSFSRIGEPKVIDVGGVKAVAFDGVHDAYQGPKTTPALEGASPRTIEVWAYNPRIDSDEETLVAWGKRGGPDASLMAFGWGRSAAYGAMAHWAADLGWNGPPRAAKWHYLVYTYDGRTAKVFDNGVEKQSRQLRLRTAAGFPILLAAQTGPSGPVQFKNEYNGSQQAGSLYLSVVRIRSNALSQAEISSTFDAEAPRFGASRRDIEGFAAKGKETFHAGGFDLTLLKATGTVASLSPSGKAFDFTPGDRLMGRATDGYHHLGDCTLRYRESNGEWKSVSSAASHESAKEFKLFWPNILRMTDLTPAFGVNCPLSIKREWVKDNGRLVLRFRISNPGKQDVELGAFGAAMVFNNLITGRSLEETHDKCSFADPYIGAGGGYLQVTRLNGQGPALLVIPEKGTSFEAYRPLWDDPTQREVTFEGFYEWMVHTKAYAENDWKTAQQWNRPTSRVLKPGQEAVYGFQFVLAPGIKQIESTLMANKRPVAIGVPGYVLPTDQTGRLFLHSASPVQNLVLEPAGSVRILPDSKPTSGGWRGYQLTGLKTGRCRITVTYNDGTKQVIHYFVTPPEVEQLKKLGAFHADKQWFTDLNDPFHRAPSFLPYNRETNRIVTQHSHSWFVGLSDEIGAGASVAMALKNLERPNAREVGLLEDYVSKTLWGHLQNPDYSVKASLFYYEPRQPDIPPGYYTIRGGWDKKRGETTWRSFNYPHVAAVYWSLYHLARDYDGLVKQQTWQWYLEHAYRTTMAIKQHAPGYAEVGLMVGSVFPEIIRDLRREGWKEKADEVEAYMKGRERRWVGLRYPFGSEMPWDSTGQEEIYTWCRYFGADDKANVTLNAVLGYMPTVPNWAYNGAARRYFDAPVNGNRWPHIIRTTNHYGSGINAIPVIDSFRRSPGDLHLLRVGYAGMSQVLANIDSEGFASYGFDCDPAILKFDPYTADYGIAFYGYARCAGAYATRHPEFGWLGFGCDVRQDKGSIQILPKDGLRKRVFVASLNLWLTLESGTFESVRVSPVKEVQVVLSPATSINQSARLRIQTGSGADSSFVPLDRVARERDAWKIPLRSSTVTLKLKERAH